MKKTENNEEKQILERLRRICSRREMCGSDIKNYLRRNFPEFKGAEKLIGELTEEKFIDTKRYVRAFVNDKMKIQKWGLLKIRKMLLFKGIPAGEIDEALNETDREEYLLGLVKIAERKLKTYKDISPVQVKSKLLSFLFSRGASTEDCYKILAMLGREGDGD